MNFFKWKYLPIFCFLISSDVFAAAIPCDMDLGHLGPQFFEIHQQLRGPLEDSFLSFPIPADALPSSRHITRGYQVTLADNSKYTFQVILTGSELIIYKFGPFGDDPEDTVRSTSLSTTLPPEARLLHESQVSGIVQLKEHPGKPIAMAIAMRDKIWIIDVISGEIVQQFTSPSHVLSVLLTPQLLAAGIKDKIVLFRPHRQHGFPPLDKPVAAYPIEGEPQALIRNGDEVRRPLIVAAAQNKIYTFGITDQNQVIPFPTLTLSASVSAMLPTDIRMINTLEPDSRLLIVRTNAPDRSKLHTYDIYRHIREPDRPPQPLNVQSLPPYGSHPNLFLFSYSRPEDEWPAAGSVIDPHTSKFFSSAVLIASPNYTRGFLFDMTGGRIGRQVSPNEVGTILQFVSPFKVFE